MHTINDLQIIENKSHAFFSIERMLNEFNEDTS